MTHAWFLESMDTETSGSATIEWLAAPLNMRVDASEDASRNCRTGLDLILVRRSS